MNFFGKDIDDFINPLPGYVPQVLPVYVFGRPVSRKNKALQFVYYADHVLPVWKTVDSFSVYTTQFLVGIENFIYKSVHVHNTSLWSALVAQLAEHIVGNDEVSGPIPLKSLS